MFALRDGEMDARDAARRWLREHPDVLARWLDGVTTIDGAPALDELKRRWQLE